MALRLVGFLPLENYFWVSVRKATHHPWTVATNDDGTIKDKGTGQTDKGEDPEYLFLSTLKVFQYYKDKDP